MNIRINHKLLSDSPYSETNKELFQFLYPGIKDLIQDIKFGPPTCYLISGYRGTGKSSFIKRIELMINDKDKPKGPQNPYIRLKQFLASLPIRLKKFLLNLLNYGNLVRYKLWYGTDKREEVNTEIVFVNLNFSHYQKKTFLLRKLIRGLFGVYPKEWRLFSP